jgi:NADH-quinone oxidoreductase subunit M
VLLAAVIIPLFGALLAWRAGSAEKARAIGLGAALLSMIAAAFNLVQLLTGGRIVVPYLAVDAVNGLPMVVIAALTLATVALLPRREATPRALGEVLLMLSATLTAYASEHLILLWLAWLVCSLPMILNRRSRPFTRLVVMASVMALGAAVWVMGSGSSFDLAVLRETHTSPGGAWGFGLIALAIFLRKGIFPLHSWPAGAFEKGSLLPAALLVNGHLGAFLLARVGLPLFPAITRESFPMLSDLALFTAALVALAALAERSPRRLFGLVLVSQASLVLAGLESLTPEGIAGALVQLMVVAVATTGLAGVYQALEGRVDQLGQRTGFLGLGNVAPRLSVFFVVCALALVGLPGTLGFAAEDLLLHGTLQSHPWIGLAMPLATALNAFTVFRLFARLFMGRPILRPTVSLDALPRERWALGAIIVFLVAGGLLPGQLVKLQSSAADVIVSALQSTAASR